MIRTTLKSLLACTSLTAVMSAQAQDATPTPKEPESIVVTGSRIKQSPINSAVPLQIISTEDLQREGISSAEQLNQYLTSNGTGADNLASNADVVSGQQRGNNGLSSANLRSQGSGATLVLLNGRRVAAHGLNGGSVDVNQIPFAAVERIEVLKDGASAIYGTDAIGGVINYILKKNFTGVNVRGFADVTEQGGGNIYKVSGLAGYGNLDDQGFNIMAGASYSWNKALRGNQRKFVNTFQPDRGLSVDTRGTPFATIVPLANSIITSAGTSPLIPGTTVRASGGINVLDLPGQAGCNAIDGQAPYDEKLWAFAEAQYACAWDTGRAAVLQQPLDTLTYVARGVGKLGDHQITLEYTGSEADSAKRFSNLQITPNTTTQNYGFARNATNAATYDRVAAALKAAFPADTVLASRLTAGTRISYRWRCIECGPREINTNVKTNRAFAGVEGPLFGGWDYATGVSYATSKARSVLGSGYYYRGTTATGASDGGPGIITALQTGLINPFLFPGETQPQAGLDLLKAASAEGVVLYGGKYTTLQADASISGSLFELPGGDAKVAIGVDYRKEKYQFNGDVRDATAQRVIVAAPFDDGNALASRSRTVKAAFVEALFPVFEMLEVTAAARVDDYSVFGSTFNPKVSFKFRPNDQLTLRGSYNTGFRVPSFNQIYNGVTQAQYTGRDIADPGSCPNGVIDPSKGTTCLAIQPDIILGGNPNLGPEKSEGLNIGLVIRPASNISITADLWRIKRTASIVSLTLQQLAQNYTLFQDRYIRNSAGTLVAIDQRLINAGASVTQGIDLGIAANTEAFGGTIGFGLDATYLMTKKERVAPSLGYDNRLGVFTFSGDLGLRWKHNANISYARDGWVGTFSQIFRGTYTNQELPGVTSGVVSPANLDKKVDPYIIYNATISYSGLLNGLKLTAGVKNIFNTDPPFAVTYDSNTGSGSSWEPRVADPRGRAFTMQVEYQF